MAKYFCHGSRELSRWAGVGGYVLVMVVVMVVMLVNWEKSEGLSVCLFAAC